MALKVPGEPSTARLTSGKEPPEVPHAQPTRTYPHWRAPSLLSPAGGWRPVVFGSLVLVLALAAGTAQGRRLAMYIWEGDVEGRKRRKAQKRLKRLQEALDAVSKELEVR